VWANRSSGMREGRVSDSFVLYTLCYQTAGMRMGAQEERLCTCFKVLDVPSKFDQRLTP
jgi:hypothetical protein